MILDDENVFKPYYFIWGTEKKKYMKFKRHPDCDGKECTCFIVIKPDGKKMRCTTRKDIKYKIDKI